MSDKIHKVLQSIDKTFEKNPVKDGPGTAQFFSNVYFLGAHVSCTTRPYFMSSKPCNETVAYRVPVGNKQD